MGNRRLTAILSLLLHMLSLSAATTCDLRCSFLSDPLGIDTVRPAFGWKVCDALRGDKQTCCRIIVASSLENLDKDYGDVWDSGKVRTHKQIALKYGGKPLVSGSQTDLCYPMLSGVIPERKIPEVETTLRKSIDSLYGGNLAAGLVGVPVVTRWATASHNASLMYGMLKKRSYPGYLYMIDHGATTTWEYWNGYRSHIHNCYNGIGSWFYEALGGIRPDEKKPGYQNFLLAPQIVEELDSVSVSKSTPYGDITSEWSRNDDILTVSVSVPFGSSATLVLPDGKKKHLKSGNHKFESRIK